MTVDLELFLGKKRKEDVTEPIPEWSHLGLGEGERRRDVSLTMGRPPASDIHMGILVRAEKEKRRKLSFTRRMKGYLSWKQTEILLALREKQDAALEKRGTRGKNWTSYLRIHKLWKKPERGKSDHLNAPQKKNRGEGDLPRMSQNGDGHHRSSKKGKLFSGTRDLRQGASEKPRRRGISEGEG